MTHAHVQKSRSSPRFLCGVGIVNKRIQKLAKRLGTYGARIIKGYLIGQNLVYDKIHCK
jgi:hypothetical protein